MKVRHMTDMNQKIDELRKYVEEHIYSQDKILAGLWGNLFKKFRKQIELQFTNKQKQQIKRIKGL